MLSYDQAAAKMQWREAVRAVAEAIEDAGGVVNNVNDARLTLRADCRPFRTNSNVEPGKSLRSAESTQPKRALGWPPTS